LAAAFEGDFYEGVARHILEEGRLSVRKLVCTGTLWVLNIKLLKNPNV
jgi:hypothetical protein